MAYGWKAHYGYYIDPNGTGHGTLASPYLDGKNISDCILTDKNTKYFIPEVDDLPQPHNVVAHSTDRELMRERFRDERHIGTPVSQGITDWRYFSLFPAQPSPSSINDQDYWSYIYWSMCQITLEGNYSPFTIVDQPYKGNPFRWCPKLCKAMVPTLYGHVAYTFVYLYEWGKLIDQGGNLYTVGSTGSITRVGSQSFSAESRIRINSFTSGTSYGAADFVVCYKAPNAQTTSCYSVQVNLNGGAVYSWAVFNGLTTVNNYVVTYLGVDNGQYDFKSDPGEDPDPYAQTGEKSKPGGGGGTGVIPGISPTPYPGSVDLLGVGAFINVYTPNAADLLALAGEMWAPNVVELIKGYVLQPMDSIISLHVMPWPLVGGQRMPIKLGFYTATATAIEVDQQYYEHDCGTIHIDEIWGSYLDYKCRFSLFLPFIGSIPLQPEDVIGKDITVKYMMNILTGSVVAYVIRDDAVIANFGGNCSFQIPLTGADKSNLISGIIGVAGAAVNGLATGGMTAPVAAGIASSSLNTAMSKTTYQKAGGLGANTAYMGIRTPYLTVYVPNMCLPDDQNGFIGYPSYITDTLGNQRGYTEVYKSHIHASGASEEELIEIENLLSSGVIIA